MPTYLPPIEPGAPIHDGHTRSVTFDRAHDTVVVRGYVRDSSGEMLEASFPIGLYRFPHNLFEPRKKRREKVE